MADITFKTQIDFGNIGGNKKLTFTSWNGNAPRYDIRDWYDDKAGKGITLDKSELKTLYGLLCDMFDDSVESDDKTDDIDTILNGEEEQVSLFDEPITEQTYPDNIQKAFDVLDKLFDGFSTLKDYGKMPFVDGERLQFYVKKENKNFPKYEDTLNKLGVKSFITGKGNLYIYTL
jgi:hypothetical protein